MPLDSKTARPPRVPAQPQHTAHSSNPGYCAAVQQPITAATDPHLGLTCSSLLDLTSTSVLSCFIRAVQKQPLLAHACPGPWRACFGSRRFRAARRFLRQLRTRLPAGRLTWQFCTRLCTMWRLLWQTGVCCWNTGFAITQRSLWQVCCFHRGFAITQRSTCFPFPAKFLRYAWKKTSQLSPHCQPQGMANSCGLWQTGSLVERRDGAA